MFNPSFEFWVAFFTRVVKFFSSGKFGSPLWFSFERGARFYLHSSPIKMVVWTAFIVSRERWYWFSRVSVSVGSCFYLGWGCKTTQFFFFWKLLHFRTNQPRLPPPPNHKLFHRGGGGKNNPGYFWKQSSFGPNFGPPWQSNWGEATWLQENNRIVQQEFILSTLDA